MLLLTADAMDIKMNLFVQVRQKKKYITDTEKNF